MPDYVRFAESFGAHAERVADPAALARVRDGQPALVDVVTAALDPHRIRRCGATYRVR